MGLATAFTIPSEARAQANAGPQTTEAVSMEPRAGLEMAEAVLAREEAASERAFDPAFRAQARTALAELPLATLESEQKGLGLNSLGDSQADLVYTPLTPCRIIDTRLAGGTIAPGTTRDFLVTGTSFASQGGSATGCGVPFGPATAAMINFVAVTPTGPGNLQVTPFGTALPLASIINYSAGLNLANGLSVALCDPSATTCTRDVTIRANNSAAHLVADVQGYFRRVSTGGVGTALLADSAVTAPKISTGTVVRSLNGLTDAVTFAGTKGLGVTVGPGTVTVASNATPENAGDTIVSRDETGSFAAGSIALSGNLDLPHTHASVGVLTMGGEPFLHDRGGRNTFVGSGAGNLGTMGNGNAGFGFAALTSNITGNENSAFGSHALSAITSGGGNSAFGSHALWDSTTGSYNSALGYYALAHNAAGTLNSAFGALALAANTAGNGNSAFGYAALTQNTTGTGNSAFGSQALSENTTGGENSAFGLGALSSNTTATGNSAFGHLALVATTTGGTNSAFGLAALRGNTTGYANSAFGSQALQTNTIGFANSAFGTAALSNNTQGQYNSAFGLFALQASTTGHFNAAFGSHALKSATTASENAAFGHQALEASTTGAWNSAFGFRALAAVGSAHENSAFGHQALGSATTGIANSAFGGGALTVLTAGNSNSAIGAYSLSSLASGHANIAIGHSAGSKLTSGSGNIYIGNAGMASEADTIRIGHGSSSTYVAGISGVTVAGGAVYVSPSGQLGTFTSSRRHKERIADIDADSDVLLKLRPVSFYYRPDLDGKHQRQYGLVAEEVAAVAPDLVAYDEAGQPQSVQYHLVNAMLLNEVQKQRRQVDEMETKIARQESTIEDLEARLARLEAALAGRR
jgi:hypothetical protein